MEGLQHIAPVGITQMVILKLAFCAMVAILFLQSGLSKVFGWKGEKDWLTGHFAKSPLHGLVPIMLTAITIVEVCAGTLALLGLPEGLLRWGTGFGGLGMLLGTGAIILLFFGQRVAKDYTGAASLIPYFLMCAAGLYLYSA